MARTWLRTSSADLRDVRAGGPNPTITIKTSSITINDHKSNKNNGACATFGWWAGCGAGRSVEGCSPVHGLPLDCGRAAGGGMGCGAWRSVALALVLVLVSSSLFPLTALGAACGTPKTAALGALSPRRRGGRCRKKACPRRLLGAAKKADRPTVCPFHRHALLDATAVRDARADIIRHRADMLSRRSPALSGGACRQRACRRARRGGRRACRRARRSRRARPSSPW